MQLGYLPVLFRMVPFNKSARKIWPLLELLAKNYTGARLLACSLARARKIFATARMLIFSLT